MLVDLFIFVADHYKDCYANYKNAHTETNERYRQKINISANTKSNSICILKRCDKNITLRIFQKYFKYSYQTSIYRLLLKIVANIVINISANTKLNRIFIRCCMNNTRILIYFYKTLDFCKQKRTRHLNF